MFTLNYTIHNTLEFTPKNGNLICKLLYWLHDSNSKTYYKLCDKIRSIYYRLQPNIVLNFDFVFDVMNDNIIADEDQLRFKIERISSKDGCVNSILSSYKMNDSDFRKFIKG